MAQILMRHLDKKKRGEETALHSSSEKWGGSIRFEEGKIDEDRGRKKTFFFPKKKNHTPNR